MKFDISSITKANGASMSIEFKDVLTCSSRIPDGYEIVGPVSFKGRLTNVNEILELDGDLEADYTTKCFRCLKDLSGHLKLNVSESFMHGEPEEGSDAYTFEGYSLELDSVFEDIIILNLPMRQICSGNCKGFCAICGANLNEGACNCKEEYINPQMEILKNLLKN
jgi:uncharacterized protein